MRIPRRRFVAAIIAVFVVIAAVAAVALTTRGQEPDNRPNRSPAPVDLQGLRTLASVAGTGNDSRVALHTNAGEVTFWGGVNLGATTPGHGPGEVAISDETYRRWLEQMGQMNISFVRIYTIHQPGFYTALRDYNLDHANHPIYLVHGVYLPDESYLKSGNLWDQGPTDAFTNELTDASKAVSGALHRDVTPGHASGDWTADVSPWLAGWIVGVEWDPNATLASDAKNANHRGFSGKYFQTSGSASVTSTETWMARQMNALAEQEASRGRSEPIAFANWPTTDPLKHRYEPLESEDLVSVDANNVMATPAWPGGTFASFHVYPYYPDFLRHEPAYQTKIVNGQVDAYAAYLEDLKRHFGPQNVPMMVTEFGVPSSIGSAHNGTRGRNQGAHTEQEAMSTDADLLHLLKDVGMSGAFLFSWSDEWFKFTWNTLPRQTVVDAERRSVWHDPLTNEQWFGIIATDPMGNGWRQSYEGPGAIHQVETDTDASFAYVRITFDQPPTQPFALSFQVLAGSGGPDHAVRVNPSAGTAQAYVKDELDPVLLDGLGRLNLPPRDGTGWSIQRLTLNRSLHVMGKQFPPEFFEVGQLRRGNFDPDAPDYDSLATWSLHENQFELRLPWSMLGMADPSSHVAVVPDANGEPTPAPVGDIAMSVESGGVGTAVGSLQWDNWQSGDAVERVKRGAEVLARAFAQTAD